MTEAGPRNTLFVVSCVIVIFIKGGGSAESIVSPFGIMKLAEPHVLVQFALFFYVYSAYVYWVHSRKLRHQLDQVTWGGVMEVVRQQFPRDFIQRVDNNSPALRTGLLRSHVDFTHTSGNSWFYQYPGMKRGKIESHIDPPEEHGYPVSNAVVLKGLRLGFRRFGTESELVALAATWCVALYALTLMLRILVSGLLLRYVG